MTTCLTLMTSNINDNRVLYNFQRKCPRATKQQNPDDLPKPVKQLLATEAGNEMRNSSRLAKDQQHLISYFVRGQYHGRTNKYEMKLE